MVRDEFYADPTLFDHWRYHIASWLEQQGIRLRPYAWTLAFTLPAVLLGVISLLEAGSLLYALSLWSGHTPWNQWLASGITLAAALCATHWLVQRALEAWPAASPLPAGLRVLTRRFGLRPPPVVCHADSQCATFRDRQALMAFFSGVKAAGVNVKIARALLKAGIRSPRQLQRASDRQLAAIHGVGAATVRKLRQQFPGDAA